VTSPLLDLPGAVAGDGIDAGVAAHYGSFNAEQRTLESGQGFVDLSHRDVVRIEGPDRLDWLHNLTTQHLSDLRPKEWTGALVLSPNGHVEHAFYGYDDGQALLAHTEPGQAAALVEFLDRMRFMMRVEVSDATSDHAVTWRPSARDETTGLDTDHRTIPNEAGWIGPAVHLDKGCYRGQETVARVHTLGRPPRRLTLLHLDGSENRLPAVHSELRQGDKVVGFVGSSARHHELGPIALAMVKRNVPLDATLDADGLHVRPKLR
jgi:folate-binding protein YgfZ